MNRLLLTRISTTARAMYFLLVFGILLGGTTSLNAQQLACNDLIQVSLDENCFFRLNLDMLLESPPGDTTCLVIRVTDAKGNLIPGGIFTSDDRSQTFDYTVLDTCNNNSCWGQILVEDKLPPQYTCNPYDTVWCSNTDYELPVDKVFEACGTFRRVIESDVSENYPCDSACAGKRWITYYYVDEVGNKSDVCVKEVCYRRATLSDIQFPQDTIFNCLDFVDAHPRRTGVPMVDSFPIFPDAQFCEVNCDYEDQIIDVCPGTQKILRKWTCYDWCMPTGPENPSITWQVVKILDEDGPVVYCPTTDKYRDTISTNPWSCTGNTILPEPHVLAPGQKVIDSSKVYIISECSQVSYSVRHLAAESPEDCTPDQNTVPSTDNVRYNATTGRWEAFDLPRGCNWFYYTFEDECGNTSECTFDIYVEDDVPPIAVCDRHTVVTLNEQGTARVYAITFDDGSIDNCAVDSMDVRRMSSNCANPTTTYGPYVEFCCQDSTAMVEFRVFDRDGNSNTCMVEVTVSDKEAPKMIPPPDITVDCRFDYDTSDLSVFGKVVIDEPWRKPIIIKDDNYAPDFFAGLDGWAWDNCEDIIISERPVFDLICGIGTIRRTFTAVDPQGLKVSKVQIITIEDRDTFGFNDIKFPKDITLTGCIGIDTDTSKTGVPEYLNVDCAHLAATFKDLTYDQVPDACYKIERRWTVVDWCAFDLGYPVWQWDYTQIIKVTDEEDPYFVNCSDTSFCDEAAYLDNGQCVGAVSLTPVVEDGCTPTNLLELRYRLDLFNTGTFGAWTPGNSLNGDYPVGEHRVEWEVQDGCGNSKRCEQLFEVKDCKAPTPYCRSGIVTVLMEGVGTITVWANDLDIGSFDNCTDTSDLIFSFDSLGKETSRTYTCDSMEGEWKIRKTVRMYVTDECGNVDYCETIIELQDNQKCTGSLVKISGGIKNENGEPVEGVAVEVYNTATGALTYTEDTDASGNYEILAIKGRGYKVQPVLDEDYLNGITTKDLTMIQRDLLGQTPLQTAYTVFAADATSNEDVGASDIAAIRKLILGRTSTFPNNDSWRFVQADYIMPDVREPWGAPENFDLPFVDGDVSDLDFVAMKVGDVDVSAETSINGGTQTRSDLSYIMQYEVQEIKGTPNTYRYDIYADPSIELGALQGTFNFGTGVEIVEVIDGYMMLEDMNMNADQIADGKLAMAWSEKDGVQAEEIRLFSFLVRGGEEEITLESQITEKIGYDLYLEALNVRLEKKANEAQDFALMQNIPNPFTNQTLISFDLPTDQEFTLSFYDPNGRMMKVVQGFGSKGRNEVRVNQYDFPSNSGTVIFYQLDTENHSATRKLIMLR